MVPSSKVWRMYLKELLENHSVSSNPMSKKSVSIENISFRDKRLGWKKFSCVFMLSISDENGEMKKISL